jgi:hypothetical protein
VEESDIEEGGHRWERGEGSVDDDGGQVREEGGGRGRREEGQRAPTHNF